MTLDGFLNVAVPVLIFLFLGILIYSKAKKPIDSFFAMVKDWFQNMGNKDEGEVKEPNNNYRIEYREAGY